MGLSVFDFPSLLAAITSTQSGNTSGVSESTHTVTVRATVNAEIPRQNIAAIAGSVWASSDTASTMSRCHGSNASKGKLGVVIRPSIRTRTGVHVTDLGVALRLDGHAAEQIVVIPRLILGVVTS